MFVSGLRRNGWFVWFSERKWAEGGPSVSSGWCWSRYLAILLGLWMKIRVSLYTSFKSVLRFTPSGFSGFTFYFLFLTTLRLSHAKHLHHTAEGSLVDTWLQLRTLYNAALSSFHLIPLLLSLRVWLNDRTLISPNLRDLHRPSRWTWCHSVTLLAPRKYPKINLNSTHNFWSAHLQSTPFSIHLKILHHISDLLLGKINNYMCTVDGNRTTARARRRSRSSSRCRSIQTVHAHLGTV